MLSDLCIHQMLVSLYYGKHVLVAGPRKWAICTEIRMDSTGAWRLCVHYPDTLWYFQIGPHEVLDVREDMP